MTIDKDEGKPSMKGIAAPPLTREESERVREEIPIKMGRDEAARKVGLDPEADSKMISIFEDVMWGARPRTDVPFGMDTAFGSYVSNRQEAQQPLGNKKYSMSPEQVARQMNLTEDVQRRYMDVLSGRMDFQQLPALEKARYDSFRNKVRAGGRQLREGEGHFGDSKEKQKEDDSQSEFEKRYSNREIEY